LCQSQPTDNLRKNSWAASHFAYVQFSQASHNPLTTVCAYKKVSLLSQPTTGYFSELSKRYWTACHLLHMPQECIHLSKKSSYVVWSILKPDYIISLEWGQHKKGLC
jgi:hypothetical protein